MPKNDLNLPLFSFLNSFLNSIHFFCCGVESPFINHMTKILYTWFYKKTHLDLFKHKPAADSLPNTTAKFYKCFASVDLVTKISSGILRLLDNLVIGSRYTFGKWPVAATSNST